MVSNLKENISSMRMNGAGVGIGIVREHLHPRECGNRSKVVRKTQEGEKTDIARVLS